MRIKSRISTAGSSIQMIAPNAKEMMDFTSDYSRDASQRLWLTREESAITHVELR